MATSAPHYPFVPKANRYLEAGQYWAVPLSDGRFVWVYEGARRVRPATAADRELPVMGTWGYSVITVLAERAFARR